MAQPVNCWDAELNRIELDINCLREEIQAIKKRQKEIRNRKMDPLSSGEHEDLGPRRAKVRQMHERCDEDLDRFFGQSIINKNLIEQHHVDRADELGLLLREAEAKLNALDQM